MYVYTLIYMYTRIYIYIAGGAVDTVVADFADLDSVAACGAVLAAKYPVIDLLVNNAGMHYNSNVMRPSKSLATVDGYDLVFSSNYLGHFLLTRFLEAALHKAPAGRLVQLSSTYHWHSDGTDLDPRLNGSVPLASVGDASQSTLRRRNLAYVPLAHPPPCPFPRACVPYTTHLLPLPPGMAHPSSRRFCMRGRSSGHGRRTRRCGPCRPAQRGW